MPEMRFQIEWPDGAKDLCYSPSLVIKDYFRPGERYTLTDFVDKSREALQIASDRVQAKFGMPCSLALGQLRHIETAAARYTSLDQPQVTVVAFVE